MSESIRLFVNICIVEDDEVLLIDRQHDSFKGWIYPGGKVEFPESYTQAAKREMKEETGLNALALKLKGISGFTNFLGNERYIYFDFICDEFDGELITESKEGNPKWWKISQLDGIEMQEDVRKRLKYMLSKDSYERINYWDNEKGCISHVETEIFKS